MLNRANRSAAPEPQKAMAVPVPSRQSLDATREMAEAMRVNDEAFENARAKQQGGEQIEKGTVSKRQDARLSDFLAKTSGEVLTVGDGEMEDHLLDEYVPVTDVLEQARMELDLASAWVGKLIL